MRDPRLDGPAAPPPAPRPRVLAFDEVNASSPVLGGVDSWSAPAPLDSDVHHTFEVGMLLAGREERHFEGFVRKVRPGDAWWAGAWEPHGWRVLAPGTKELVIHFVPDLFGEAEVEGLSWLSFFAAPPQDRPIPQDARTRARVLRIGLELVEEFQQRSWGWRDSVRWLILRMLVIIARAVPEPHGDWRQTRSTAGKLARVMPAIDLIHADLTRRVPLRTAAAACQLSPSRFRMLFWETMGVTYSHFERRARLAQATRLLLTTNTAIETVAESVGFADGSHFHRVFQQHYGCTPTHFRTQGRTVRQGD